MNEHVGKPIDPDTLFATLMRWARPRVEVRAAGRKPAAPAKDVILPEIEGVDLADGLRRVNGNKQLYRDLLVQFAASQSGVDSHVLTAIQKGDNTLVERIAHTVKGVAGNIGLRDLFTIAGKLERAAGEDDPAAPPLVEEFTAVLRRQIYAIRLALRDLISAREAPAKAVPGCDPGVIAAIAQLRPLLELSDADALDAFAALERALANKCDRVRLNALRTAIDEFNFEDALLKLDYVAQEYIANPEQIR
jgi:HPt (histidine-containing phosphotransfer) domain-containing protein